MIAFTGIADNRPVIMTVSVDALDSVVMYAFLEDHRFLRRPESERPAF